MKKDEHPARLWSALLFAALAALTGIILAALESMKK